MSESPIDYMLDTVDWEVSEEDNLEDDGIPYATHNGVLDILGSKLRCYRLSDGKTVFDADDVEKLFGQVPQANCLFDKCK